MILINRGSEPAALAPVRTEWLAKLRKIAATRDVTSDDIDGYRVVAADLWRAQHYKCCYCEGIFYQKYQDVEHLRPKARADRSPGCKDTHGYFWLAYTWSNLLFACNLCNRTSKNDKFPLENGSQALQDPEEPPGKEESLLVDPAVENGVRHIVFRPWRQGKCLTPTTGATMKVFEVDRWQAHPRRGSVRGRWSIDVFGINHAELIELYLAHVRNNVSTCVDALRNAIRRRANGRVEQEFSRARMLFTSNAVYAGLSYDAIKYFVPNSALEPFHLAWPDPKDVG